MTQKSECETDSLLSIGLSPVMSAAYDTSTLRHQ